MNNFIKNILLLILSIVLSYFTAEYVGKIYSSILGSGGSWVGNEGSWNFVIGFPLSLIFFLTLITYTWMLKSKASVLWIISPLFIWEIIVDLRHMYFPIILALIAFGLASLIRKMA